ncbi:MAG: hypothetical protein IIC13_06170 [SAR324 cluster bacterium]|nr:hypothetical protein [SAR324 cluster bacterium]
MKFGFRFMLGLVLLTPLFLLPAGCQTGEMTGRHGHHYRLSFPGIGR